MNRPTPDHIGGMGDPPRLFPVPKNDSAIRAVPADAPPWVDEVPAVDSIDDGIGEAPAADGVQDVKVSDPIDGCGWPEPPTGVDAGNDHLGPIEPGPLLRETPPAAPYPLEALGPLQSAAEAVHDISQAPAAIAAQSVLGVAALAVQGLANAETLRGAAPRSLFLLTVARSGERKSTCDRLVMSAVRDYENELADRVKLDGATHRNRHELWSERRKAILKNANTDPILAEGELDALGPEPEPPLYPSIVASEPTYEAVVKHMGRLRPALGLFSDEGGSFVGGVGMSSENRLKTLSGLSRLWDGAPIDRWRAGDGVSMFRGRRLSLHLLMQPVAAEGLLADPTAQGQGILGRCLTTDPPSAIGTRTRIGHDPKSDTALASFASHLGDVLRRPLPLKDGAANNLSFESGHPIRDCRTSTAVCVVSIINTDRCACQCTSYTSSFSRRHL